MSAARRKALPAPVTVDPLPPKQAIAYALTCQRASLFQVLGIVRMAAQTIREPGYKHAETDVWEALDGAVELIGPILDRLENYETLVAEEVRRGDY
jgi:hypothetical protein